MKNGYRLRIEEIDVTEWFPNRKLAQEELCKWLERKFTAYIFEDLRNKKGL